MLAGPNTKKCKLNEISNQNGQAEEVKEEKSLKQENEQLKANYNTALNWIKAAESLMDKNGILEKFNI